MAVIAATLLAATRDGQAQAASGFTPPSDDVVYAAILQAEDERAGTAQSLDLLIARLTALDTAARRMAVRAVGRLERSDLVSRLAPRLDDRDAGVRAEAANAIGQAVFGEDGEEAADLLLRRLGVERDASVRGTIAQTLGRLRLDSLDAIRAIEVALVTVASEAAPEARLGAARGFESLTRRLGRTSQLAPQSLAQLRALARDGLRPEGRGLAPTTATARRIRRLATASLLSAANRPGAGAFDTALADPDGQVRRIAAAALAGWDSLTGRTDLMDRAFVDLEPSVRLEGVRVYGNRLQATRGCRPLLSATTDPNPHVALLAIDLLSAGCPATDTVGGADSRNSVTQVLIAAVADLPPAGDSTTWHRAAHALVALARLSPSDARAQLDRFTTHGSWLVRAYAARAAAVVQESPSLERLAADPNDNVRHAAVVGLAAVRGHDADPIYIAQLQRADHQLVREAALALAKSPRPAAAIPALLVALRRQTDERSETGFEARMALLERIGELAGAAQADAVRPYLSDFEPRIAAEAAAILSRWTGSPVRATPGSFGAAALPSRAEIAALDGARAVIDMHGGGRWVIRLRVAEAPTNVCRFVRLARQGTLNGLTFHRVVPNFVIQGLSPGANEYQGDPPYTRDELVMDSHLRGTVGISTRGRDTADNQIFVSLVDNVRLDHNYTIIGDVVEGMAVVDAVLEGAVVDRITIESPR